MQEMTDLPNDENEGEPNMAQEKTVEPEAIEEKRRRPSVLLWSVLVLVAFILGMGAGYLVWARPLQARVAAAEQKLAANSAAAAADTSQQDAQQVKRYDIPIAGSPAFGNEKAPITIIEFSDYQCPYCKQWHAQVWPLIQAKYGNKIRLVYRDFPLYTIHPDAIPAAEAAACAGEQNKYFEFGDLLFNGGKDLKKESFDAYAQQVGLNLTSFNKCVDERKYQKKVEENYTYASELGVRSTPTFFINGLAVVGAQPFEVFQQVIDMELAGKIPK